VEAEDQTHKAFWEKLGQIKGLSVSTGLERIEGQKGVYEKTLKLIIQEIERSETNLNVFLSAEDIENFRIEVHGIKSALANIGAMELSARAYDFEIASAKKDIDFCAAGIPSLLDGLSKLKSKLQEAFSTIDQCGGPINIPPELPALFERMISAFGEIDLVRIDQEIANLNALNLTGTLRNGIEQIKDMVLMMDYDGATEHMRKLVNDNALYRLPGV
jgi:HPt (histidine-containing phosphotransfer) domain-containing protein